MAGRAAGEEGGRSGGGAGGGGGGRGAPAAELGAHSCILPQGSVPRYKIPISILLQVRPLRDLPGFGRREGDQGVGGGGRQAPWGGEGPEEEGGGAGGARQARGGRRAEEQEVRRPGKVVRLLESETGNQLPAVLASSILANGQS